MVIDRHHGVRLRGVPGIIVGDGDEVIATVDQRGSRLGKRVSAVPVRRRGIIVRDKIDRRHTPARPIPIEVIREPANEAIHLQDAAGVIGGTGERIRTRVDERTVDGRSNGHRRGSCIDREEDIIHPALRNRIDAVAVVRRSTERILTCAQGATRRVRELPAVCPDVGCGLDRSGKLHLSAAPAGPAPILTGAHMIERKVHGIARNARPAVVRRSALNHREALDE